MNSVSNSDSEQCTESKLGWVHQVPTLAQPTRTSRATVPRLAVSRRVVARTGAVSQAQPGRVATYAQPCRALCRARHVVAPPSILLRVPQLPAPYRGAFPKICRAYLATQPNGRAALLSRFNLLYRHKLPQQPGPRERAAVPCAGADRVVGPLGLVAG